MNKLGKLLDEFKANTDKLNYNEEESVMEKLDGYFKNFTTGLKTLLPRSKFALYEDGTGYSIAIFEKDEHRRAWIKEYSDFLPKPISHKAFCDIVGSCWNDPAYYRHITPEDVVCFTVY